MRPNNNALLSAVAASANQASVAQWAWDIIRASFQLTATGTAAGAIQVQASNDKAVGLPPNQFQPTNWSNVGAPVTVAGAGAYITPVVECSYEYLRIIYTDSSSGSATGTLSARMKSAAL